MAGPELKSPLEAARKPPFREKEGEKPPPGPPSAASPDAFRMLWLTLAAVLVVMFVAGYLVAFYSLRPRIKAVSEAAALGKLPPGSEGKQGHDSPDAKGKGGKDEFIIPELYVTIPNTGGSRYLKARIEFEAPPAVLKEMQNHRAQIYDIIASVLETKHLDELTSSGVRQRLRSEIMTLVNTVLKAGEVTTLYFPELIVQ
ncbi:MAG: flagellar basal body-associated FliL family protein [Verrucomicrobia bacterium]|nr:flagellar basal body-associated FliL family protein [Verrucomicrobiota bacterium]